MEKLNIDSMYAPIEFTLNGKDYKIEKVDSDLLSRIDSVDKTNPIDGVIEQFSILTGIAKEEARFIDIRKIQATVSHIMKSVTPGDASKNA